MYIGRRVSVKPDGEIGYIIKIEKWRNKRVFWVRVKSGEVLIAPLNYLEAADA